METSALQQLLKSLSNNSHWIYAVFWKIKYQSPAILTWEDGYCNFPKWEKDMGSTTEEIRLNGSEKSVSSCYGPNIHNGDAGNCSVGPVMAVMSCLQYALGEGMVGNVASSGNHDWVFLENIFTSDVFSALIYEGPGPIEWLIQYASGIKTILLVPVLPFGVLQLGSLQMVTEDLSVVGYIKDRFSVIHFVDGNATNVASENGVWPLYASAFAHSIFENLDEQTNLSTNMLEIENHGASNDVKPAVSTSNQFVTIQDVLTVSSRISPEEPFARLYQSINASEVDLSDFFSLEPQPRACTQLRNDETGLFGGNDLSVHSYSTNDVVRQQFGHNFVTKKEYDTADNFFSFPDECELREVLGPAFHGQKQTNEFLYNSSGSIKATTSNLMCSRDFIEGDIEHLLEALITAYDNSDDNLSNRAVNVRIAPTLEKLGNSAQQCSQSESSAIVVDDPAPWMFPEPTVTEIGRKNLTSLSTSNSQVINKWEENGLDITQPRKGIKNSNPSRRTKGTSNPRQRPRDRQLIQDRIKELRQIVPNGAKCSIDGLLEKTIKHMLYLQRVTDQAEKLKQLVQPDEEEEGSDSENSPPSRQNGGSSWTWAFDIGNELQVCPIVVEDLEYQGHMLIKMICEDMGLFLEIAEIIRNLELMILKGVIERHSNNSWAHFIVEAPRGFHRMDVFWPLMHILQRKRNPISSRI